MTIRRLFTNIYTYTAILQLLNNQNYVCQNRIVISDSSHILSKAVN